MQRRDEGFSIVIVLILAVLVIGALVVWRLWPSSESATNTSTDTPAHLINQDTQWSFNGNEWLPADGLPPKCPDPFPVASPADITMAHSILYPGQTRGGDYKPHGGFRFDGKTNEAITVRAPFDAKLVDGSRYIEAGEVQYLFTFINPCGMAYRLDHLLTLSPEIQKIADKLPAATESSRTTKFDNPVLVKKGEVIATAVGHKKPSLNVAFDFGLYDLRTQNMASRDEAFMRARANQKEYGWYGVCWLTWLRGDERSKVEALPAADQTAGKTSDYCK